MSELPKKYGTPEVSGVPKGARGNVLWLAVRFLAIIGAIISLWATLLHRFSLVTLYFAVIAVYLAVRSWQRQRRL